VAIGLSLTEKNKPAYLKTRVVDAMTAGEPAGLAQNNVEPGSQVITDFPGAHAMIGGLGYDHECKVYDKEGPEYLKWITSSSRTSKLTLWAQTTAWTARVRKPVLMNAATGLTGDPDPMSFSAGHRRLVSTAHPRVNRIVVSG
jgi:hypothetical protein